MIGKNALLSCAAVAAVLAGCSADVEDELLSDAVLDERGADLSVRADALVETRIAESVGPTLSGIPLPSVISSENADAD